MELLNKYFSYIFVYFGSVLLLRAIWSRRKVIRISFATIHRDLTFCYTTFWKMLIRWIWMLIKNKTVSKSLDKVAQNSPSATCFFYENERWTYDQVQIMSFQVANFFRAQGYRKGDVVGLAMHNRPEVVCIWLGLSRLGVTTALINFNLKGASLHHSVLAAKCKSVIYGFEIREDIWQSPEDLETLDGIVLYELDRYLDRLHPLSHKVSVLSDTSPNVVSSSVDFKTVDFAQCLRNASTKPTVDGRGDEKVNFMDCFLYIYTSGTTGMPKAAKSSHGRLNMLGLGRHFMALTEKDVVYCPLPLYHTFALTGTIWALVHGIPLVIVPKFSASKFWSDIHFYKVTACLYMGELCRFIVNQPVQPELERNHNLRVMFGCGVKPEVWETFINRFNIHKFVEAYGSTEGNCTLVNMEGTKVGAIGYIPRWVQPFYSVTNIKVDEVTGEIIRDKKTGRATACKSGESGELVGRIVNFFPSLRYDGYTSKEANEKKIAQNLFRRGDRYFRSGDIVTKDEYGYFYFKDRIGDTYRWKGENVSTAEVEGLILRLTDMKTTVVYGVQVPGTEGRAGMAAIVDPDGEVDLSVLADGFERGLPSFARPQFIRCIRGINVVNMTGTFKLQKFNLQNEGFDIDQIQDPIFVYNVSLRGYQKLEREIFNKIMQGNYRF